MTGLESFLNRKTTHNTMYVRIIVILADEWIGGKKVCVAILTDYHCWSTVSRSYIDRT